MFIHVTNHVTSLLQNHVVLSCHNLVSVKTRNHVTILPLIMLVTQGVVAA